MTGLFTTRFTAKMHIRVPAMSRVVGSGSGVAAQKSLPGNRTEFTFKWTKPASPHQSSPVNFLNPSPPATCASTSLKAQGVRP